MRYIIRRSPWQLNPEGKLQLSAYPVIPDYEILTRCGRGAFGEVYLVRNRAGTKMALKVLENDASACRELDGLRSLARAGEIPGVIRIHHVGEAGNLLYYTMDAADNLAEPPEYRPATLGRRLAEKKRFSTSEVCDLGRELLLGLAGLHAAGLMHRDVKTENILFVHGEPVLSDIGLVRSVSQTQTLGGTLGYLPPERLLSGSGGNRRSDDLYSLGKVLYCAWTGNPPEAFPSLPADLLGEPECCRLNEVLLTACASSPLRRFRSAEEFRRALMEGISPGKKLRNGLFASGALLRNYGAVGVLAVLAVLVAGKVFRPEFFPWSSGGAAPVAVAQKPALTPVQWREISARMEVVMDIDSGEDNHLTESFMEARVYQKHSPRRLDRAPRRREEIPLGIFLSDDWAASGGALRRENRMLQIHSRADCVMELKKELAFPYALQFDADFSRLDGTLFLEVVVPGEKPGENRAIYSWSLDRDAASGAGSRIRLRPLRFSGENIEPGVIVPTAELPEAVSAGPVRVEMSQTEYFFRLYFNGKLVLHAPSFFFGGTFRLRAETAGSNEVKLENPRLCKIPSDPKTPPEQQYYLPTPLPAKRKI